MISPVNLRKIAVCGVVLSVCLGVFGGRDYDEPQRAQFHFTPKVGWMNDPNGPCFYKGEWHLFYQANPDGLGWGIMRWGHAVSKDLVHWQQLDLALQPDEYGSVFSGSAVVDKTNVAGFGKDELLFFYTAAGKDFTQRMAHSSDGRTVVKVPGEPVLPVQGKENRDPHVFRYHDGRWVMVLYVPTATRHGFNIYNSTDLRNWKLASVYEGPTFEEIDFYDWELPQLFELPIRGTSETRWVLMGASGNYAVGRFDGATFVPDARNLPGVVKAEPGGSWPKPNWPKFGYNSSLVFAGNEDGRTLLISWYHLFTKDAAFTQAAGLPLEVTLEPTQDGPRLAYFPARELACLRSGEAVPLETFEGELLEADVECRVAPGGKAEYSFRGIPVVYDRNAGTLTIEGESVPWQTDYGRLKLRVFQDRIGLEVFDPSGLQAFVQPKACPSRDNLRVSLRPDAAVTGCQSSVWRLKSIYRSAADDTARLQSLLDKRGDVTFPAGDYEIARTLVIRGGTHLVCQPGFRARLADGANCAILANRLRGDDVETDISICGGVWDGNNAGQARAKYGEDGYAPGLGFYADKPLKFGYLMVLSGVRGLSLGDMTFKDPEAFCAMLTDIEDFTVTNIVFDCNDRTPNEDGIHVNGYARRGRIIGLRGHTNDDLVALNADEGDWRSKDNGIEDILIEDLDGCENGYTAVRLLSRDAPVRNVTIRNVRGKFQHNLVSFTHWAGDKYKPGMGHFDNVTVEDVTATSSRKSGGTHGGLIWFQDGVQDVGDVIVRRLNRVEGEGYLNTTATIEVGADTKIRRLKIEDVKQSIPDAKPLLKIADTARIECLEQSGEANR